MESHHKKDIAFNNMLNHVLEGSAHTGTLEQEAALVRAETLLGFQRSLARTPADGFIVGQIVQWKSGMKNRSLPEYGQPAIIVEILDPPVYESNKELSGTNLFREPLSLVLGLTDSDGDFLCYHYDGRRFELSPDNGENYEP